MACLLESPCLLFYLVENEGDIRDAVEDHATEFGEHHRDTCVAWFPDGPNDARVTPELHAEFLRQLQLEDAAVGEVGAPW